MLRTRHHAFVVQQRQDSLCWLCRRKAEALCGISWLTMDAPLATAGGQPSSVGAGEVTGSVDLCEEGNSNQAFAQIVVWVVCITEEGLFRNVMSYLGGDDLASGRTRSGTPGRTTCSGMYST